MRIERIELRKILLPYVAPFETSGWRETGSHAIIVRTYWKLAIEHWVQHVLTECLER